MPQLTPLGLRKSDGTDISFAPKGITNGVARLNSSTGVPIADPTLTMSTNQTANGRQKVVFKLAVPVVQDNVVSGVARPTVVRTAYADITLSFDGSSTVTERKDIASFINRLMALDLQPLVNGVIANVEGIY